jgi:hypothetical protein
MISKRIKCLTLLETVPYGEEKRSVHQTGGGSACVYYSLYKMLKTLTPVGKLFNNA